MPKARAHRYSIEIKYDKGSLLFSTAAYWNGKDRHLALAQIARLPGLPEINIYAEPALETKPGKSETGAARSRSKTARSPPR